MRNLKIFRRCRTTHTRAAFTTTGSFRQHGSHKKGLPLCYRKLPVIENAALSLFVGAIELGKVARAPPRRAGNRVQVVRPRGGRNLARPRSPHAVDSVSLGGIENRQQIAALGVSRGADGAALGYAVRHPSGGQDLDGDGYLHLLHDCSHLGRSPWDGCPGVARFRLKRNPRPVFASRGLINSEGNYSHSIVAGGLLVMSYATRFTPGTSATMRPEMRASTS